MNNTIIAAFTLLVALFTVAAHAAGPEVSPELEGKIRVGWENEYGGLNGDLLAIYSFHPGEGGGCVLNFGAYWKFRNNMSLHLHPGLDYRQGWGGYIFIDVVLRLEDLAGSVGHLNFEVTVGGRGAAFADVTDPYGLKIATELTYEIAPDEFAIGLIGEFISRRWPDGRYLAGVRFEFGHHVGADLAYENFEGHHAGLVRLFAHWDLIWKKKE